MKTKPTIYARPQWDIGADLYRFSDTLTGECDPKYYARVTSLPGDHQHKVHWRVSLHQTRGGKPGKRDKTLAKSEPIPSYPDTRRRALHFYRVVVLGETPTKGAPAVLGESKPSVAA